MTTIAWRVWSLLTGPATPQFGTRETALLVILAASLVVFRAFRERSLLVWIAGWLAYLGGQAALLSTAVQLSPVRTAVGQAAFVLALTLFVAGAFLYARTLALLAPLVAIGLSLALLKGLEGFYGPASPSLRFALELSDGILALSASIAVVRFRRRQIGSWVFAVTLPLALGEGWPGGFHLPPGTGIFLDTLLALGMLILILDQSKLEQRRLTALNRLAGSLTGAGQDATLAASSALGPLAELMRTKAVWFRLRDGRSLTLFQQIGLSPEFLRARASIPENDELEPMPADRNPLSLSLSRSAEASSAFEREKLRHLILVGIPGKNSLLGDLVLASKRRRSYLPDELEFLSAVAAQLGSSVENLRLVQEVLRSQRHWTNTFDSIPDFVLLHDSEFRILKANPALLARLSKSPAEVVGQLCQQVLPNPGMKWKKCPYCHGLEEGFCEGPDPFGGFSLRSTSTYVDQGTKQKATVHVVRDVTERRTGEQKYRLLFEQMHEGVFVASPEGTLVECNQAFVRMLGHLSREELVGRNLDRDFYSSREQRRAFRQELEAHNLVRNFEVSLRRKDGAVLTALETGFASRDPSGKISGYQGFLLDITEKKQAEDEIRRRNRELNALNATAVIATQSFDLDEILNLTLRQVVSLFRAESGSVYLAESENRFRCRANWGRRLGNRQRADATFPEGLGDLVMRSRAEVLSEEYLPHLPEPVSRFVAAGDANRSLWVVLWGKDAPIGLLGISRRLGDEYSANEQNLLVAIGRQLATTVEKVRLYEETTKAYEHLRSTQEQLLQSEKMSAIGQLIAGVAHELNNPLTAILGYAQLLVTEKIESRPLDYVEKISKQAQRTHRVVQNLLSIARQRKPDKHEFDVVQVLEETLLLRDYDMKISDIKLEREIHGSIPAVSGDPHQLEQVFLNIINNAIDAILEEKAKGRPCRLKVRVSFEKNSILIQFEDSGPGLNEPSRIFEPFYTTKSEGKGTGLGLSICYGIIKEHGGEISARNSEEGGAIVEVRLPAAGSVEAASGPAREPKRREGVLEGTILLVDDEEAVLEFEREVLAGAGARVTSVSSLDQMKAMLEKETFNSLIMNGKMPGSSSVPETRRWICESWPQLSTRLLFTFSSLAEPEVRSFLEQNRVPFLVKPFEIGDLIAKARKLLAKVQAAATS